MEMNMMAAFEAETPERVGKKIMLTFKGYGMEE